jgi:hypothetical protein
MEWRSIEYEEESFLRFFNLKNMFRLCQMGVFDLKKKIRQKIGKNWRFFYFISCLYLYTFSLSLAEKGQ